MPRGIRQRLGRIRMTVTVDKPAFARLSDKYGARRVNPYLHDMMDEMGEMLATELGNAARDAYPMAVHQLLADSAGHHYDRHRGTLTVGFNTAGVVDPTSGKPLANYMTPIQSFSDHDERTRPPDPPLVVVTPSGRLITPPGSAIGRLVQWARDIGASDPRAFALTVAKRFQKIGMPRKPIFSTVFRIFGNRAQTRRGGLEAAVQPHLRGRIRSITQSTKWRIVRDLG